MTEKTLKEMAREIFHDALAEVRVKPAFREKVVREGSRLLFGDRRLDLADFKQVWVISLGKAAWATYAALSEVLGEEYAPVRGVVASNIPAWKVPEGFHAFHAGHPVPDRRSFDAGRAVLDLLRHAGEGTLIFFLISGGGSSLVESPLEPGVTLADMKALNKLLVECGANIHEINTIRKHLSAIKGGRLREAAGAARSVTFLLSDVPEGQLATIASGPTLPDPTTVAQCYEVAERFHLMPRLPESIRRLFEQKRIPETPKRGAPIFDRGDLFILLSNRDALEATRRQAEARGFRTRVSIRCDDWKVNAAADCLLGVLEQTRDLHAGESVAVISGGEVLVEVLGAGRGGRNQEFVLRCVERISGDQVAVLSAGTDGVDGNSQAAGAVADGRTLERARKKGLVPGDFLARSDSYRFFEALDDALVTGPQQNNLRDLRILLAR